MLLLEEQTKNRHLLVKISSLEERIRELERLQLTSEGLSAEADCVVSLGNQIVHGPDTPAHFTEFSLDAVIDELQSLAPNLLDLIMCLGDVDRNTPSGGAEVSREKMKAVTSMCLLMNARSARVKGIQLLLSLMLIARATNKQVSVPAYTIN